MDTCKEISVMVDMLDWKIYLLKLVH